MTCFVVDCDAVLDLVAGDVAVAQLQADAFVTRDEKLAREVRELVTTATIDDLSA